MIVEEFNKENSETPRGVVLFIWD